MLAIDLRTGNARACLAMIAAACALLAGCHNRSNAPGFYEDYSGKRHVVKEQLLKIPGGDEQARITAVDELYRMLSAGGDEESAVRYFAFRPRRGMARVIIAVEKFPEGIAILRETIPEMLPLLDTDRRQQVDALLRAVQGSSPVGSDRSAWQQWWQRSGRKIFGATSGD